ncbi:MAG: NADH:ubiquinone reductase (Na(+)-transporting) subunit C [Planctomycetota bacterium]
MDKNGNSYVVFFAVAICAVCAVALASTFSAFREGIESNELFDQQKNVLIATGLHSKDQVRPDKELRELYAKSIRAKVLEVERGAVDVPVKRAGVETVDKVEQVLAMKETEHKVEDLAALMRAESKKPDPKQRREYVPIYQRVDDAGNTVAWCIPISGYGLWSTLYGFLALEPDLATVKGITFYKHAETPGLGGEVDNLDWQRQWPGKKVLDARGQVLGVALKKGKVDTAIAAEREHMVDGLSGATITSNGVTKFVKADLERYEPYFKTKRKN